jgi:hypothetical protein
MSINPSEATPQPPSFEDVNFQQNSAERVVESRDQGVQLTDNTLADLLGVWDCLLGKLHVYQELCHSQPVWPEFPQSSSIARHSTTTLFEFTGSSAVATVPVTAILPGTVALTGLSIAIRADKWEMLCDGNSMVSLQIGGMPTIPIPLRHILNGCCGDGSLRVRDMGKYMYVELMGLLGDRPLPFALLQHTKITVTITGSTQAHCSSNVTDKDRIDHIQYYSLQSEATSFRSRLNDSMITDPNVQYTLPITCPSIRKFTASAGLCRIELFDNLLITQTVISIDGGQRESDLESIQIRTRSSVGLAKIQTEYIEIEARDLLRRTGGKYQYVIDWASSGVCNGKPSRRSGMYMSQIERVSLELKFRNRTCTRHVTLCSMVANILDSRAHVTRLRYLY